MGDEKKKKPLQLLRDRYGPPRPELRERVKELKRIDTAILAALQEEAKTVPQLAEEIRLSTDVTLWHVMGLRKYGQVVEAEQDGDYFKYRLVEESKE